METVFDITADLDTPVSAFLKLTPFQPRFLLESVEGGDRLGRYSFIGFGPAFEWRLQNGHLRVAGAEQPYPTDRVELLDSLRSALKQAPKPGPRSDEIPFPGGLVGAIGYGMHSHFDRRFLVPGAEDTTALFMAPASVLVFDHMTRRAALLHDGPDDDRKTLRAAVISALRGPTPSRPLVTVHAPPKQSLEYDDFLAGVDKTKQHIRAGDIYQLVLSVQFTGSCDVQPFEVYRALRLLNPSPYLYYVDFGDISIVGSSPEALVRLSGREASLRPIAGTKPRGATRQQDRDLAEELLADPKENAEHVMLVDLARNDLGRVAVPGSVAVDPYKTIERYSHVMHMVSGVRGVLPPETDAFDLFSAAFPAGTVVGAPKIRAIEIIDELEPVPRGLYAGTVGYFGHGGSMDQAIAIRTLVFQNGSYTYQAGAGIVADSVPTLEHAEVLAKSAALESALTLAEEGL